MRLLGPLLVLGSLASGCATVRYLGQAAAGQYQLLHEARPLEAAISDHGVPASTRGLLVQVDVIKTFAASQGLKPTVNYTRFVDLHRPAAVWVVQGCAATSFEVYRWWFPVVGSVPYLGFFDEGEARRAAQALRASEVREGLPLDVTVRTAAAYSTLGWFRDPVLSTMLHEGPGALAELANTVLHESVHATIYMKDQSTFDESLASFVADRLTEAMLQARFGPTHPETVAWHAEEARTARFHAALQRAHDDLQALYVSKAPSPEKLARKAERLEALKAELGTARAFNNADLAGVRTYTAGAEAFGRLEAACGGTRGLLRALATLRADDFDEPQQLELGGVLERLGARACAPGGR